MSETTSDSGFKTVLRHMQMHPHGDRLLSSGASFWLFGARVLVLAMAAAEALAWGYLGYLFGDGWVQWVTAFLTGIVIFLVVWMIDVSLLTLDRASEEHALQIFGERPKGGNRTLRTGFAVGTRIFVVVASLTITAPYLSQLVFHKEIHQWIEAEATKKIDKARVDLMAMHAENLAEKDFEIQQKRIKLEAEVAGAGVSGVYGKGPAAIEIEQSILALERDRAQLDKEQKGILTAFEADVATWRDNPGDLATRYNLVLPQSSILSNREALMALRKRPEHQQTELAIKAFLGFIFVGLLILKLFEPRSIKLYLSEVLQGENQRYLAGSFDHLLPENEQSTADTEAMTPQRLYDFLVNVWAPRRDHELKDSESRARHSLERQRITMLEDMMRQFDGIVDRARKELRQDREERDRATKSYQQLMSAIEIVKGDVATFKAQNDELQTTDRFDPRGKAEYGSHVRTKLGQAERKLRELQQAEQAEKQKLDRTRVAVKEAEEALHQRTEDLRRVEAQIQEARTQMIRHFTPPADQPLQPVLVEQ